MRLRQPLDLGEDFIELIQDSELRDRLLRMIEKLREKIVDLENRVQKLESP